jgi:hypothetical protein
VAVRLVGDGGLGSVGRFCWDFEIHGFILPDDR